MPKGLGSHISVLIYTHSMFKKKQLAYLYLVLNLFLQCSFWQCKKQPPFEPDPGFKTSQEAPPLQQAWKDNLATLGKVSNKNLLEENIIKLSLSDREAILDIIEHIEDLEHKKTFLGSIASFDQSRQAQLLRILVYLYKADKELIYKALRCHKCLTVIDLFKLARLNDHLPQACQELLKEFLDAILTDE